ncbi:hypothetical protein Pelo_3539 [Pelomyxa schiedti]|nr:hypothetical protein Pelo_3539 [Pelomyxa schiedti]
MLKLVPSIVRELKKAYLSPKLRQPVGDDCHPVLRDAYLMKVLKYLDARSLASCQRVCRHWYDLASSEELWRTRFLRDFPRSRLYRYQLMCWRSLYKSRATNEPLVDVTLFDYLLFGFYVTIVDLVATFIVLADTDNNLISTVAALVLYTTTLIAFLWMIAGPRPIDSRTKNGFATGETTLALLLLFLLSKGKWTFTLVCAEYFVMWLGIFLEALTIRNAILCIGMLILMIPLHSFSSANPQSVLATSIAALCVVVFQGLACYLFSLVLILRHKGAATLPNEFGRGSTISFVRRRTQWAVFASLHAVSTARFAVQLLAPPCLMTQAWCWDSGCSWGCHLTLAFILFLLSFVGCTAWSYIEYYCIKL